MQMAGDRDDAPGRVELRKSLRRHLGGKPSDFYVNACIVRRETEVPLVVSWHRWLRAHLSVRIGFV